MIYLCFSQNVNAAKLMICCASKGALETLMYHSMDEMISVEIRLRA